VTLGSLDPGGRGAEDRARAGGAEPPRLRIDVDEPGGRVTLALTGEVDLEDAERVQVAIEDAIARAAESVTVDLRAVSFLGSTGVRLLLAGHERARAAGRGYRLAVGEGPARRVVELLELHRSLEIVSLPEAGSARRLHIDPGALAQSVEGLGAIVSGSVSVEDDLDRVIGATQRLFAVTGTGLMLADSGTTLRYVVATDDGARALETAQEELGEGPCIDCFVRGALVTSDDLAGDERWPRLGPLLAPKGVRAVLGVPTRLNGAPVGSLNVYRDTPYAWDDSDVGAIEAYNGVIESLLASAIAAQRSGRVVAQLQEALDTRVVIERAVGLLMGRQDVDAVRAFNLLRQAARDSRRKVADVAADVLEGRALTSDRAPGSPPAR
jgi:anti-anti-sigma factor